MLVAQMVLEAVGAGNCVVAGQAAFRYSLVSPSQRAVLTTWRCPVGAGDQESVRDSVHEDSASAHIAAGQRPRPSFRHP